MALNKFSRLFNKQTLPLVAKSIPEDARAFLSAKELLEPYDKLIRNIKMDCNATADYFDRYYMPCLNRFAEIVQNRPYGDEGEYAKAGGALEMAIKRAALSLKLRLGYLLPPNEKPEEANKYQDRWTYGVFVSALLRDMGGVLFSTQLICFDNNDTPKGEWIGWHDKIDTFSHYRMRKNPNITRSLSASASVIQLSTVLPRHGLLWLHQEPRLLDCILDLLGGARKLTTNPVYTIIFTASQHIKANDLSLLDSYDFNAEQPRQESIDMQTGEVLSEPQTLDLDSLPEPQQERDATPEPTPSPEPMPEPAAEAEPKHKKPEPVAQPKPATEAVFSSENMSRIVRDDIKSGELQSGLAWVDDEHKLNLKYPSAFKHYTHSPAKLLDELRMQGLVLEEKERIGGAIDRVVIIK